MPSFGRSLRALLRPVACCCKCKSLRKRKSARASGASGGDAREIYIHDDIMASVDFDSANVHPFNVVEEGLLMLWRHPYLRLLVVVALAVLDFVMFVEDPCSFAQTQASLPVIGNLYNLFFHGWPKDALGFGLKVALLAVTLPGSFLFGRFVLHHWLLRNMLGLRMFSDDNGTVFAELIGIGLGAKLVTSMWGITVRFLYAASLAEEYEATAELGITEETLAYVLQILCAAGDVLTLVMLLDSMLQDTSQHRNWQASLREKWERPAVRLSSTWLLIVILFSIEVFFVTEYGDWDVVFLESERSRSFVAAVIFMLDLFTVCQDWEFPFFDNPLEIKLVGWKSPNLDLGCNVCRCSGKWMNYGPMVLVMFLDLNNLCNQWRYGVLDAPLFYGQYLGKHGEIWSTTNGTLASRMRRLYMNNSTRYNVNRNRGTCLDAIPYTALLNSTSTHWAIDTLPPCFPGDKSLNGSFWDLNFWDMALPAVPIVLALTIFGVTAHHIPRMLGDQRRRNAAMSAAEEDAHVSLLAASQIELPELEYLQLRGMLS